ncbi:DNA-deoxyinosine glycosylase [Methylosarcina fibrata]|uniref:DNA-deoxyinosine glycosylase n=1 Tax=Methylosarcina fibrata TaxID=105972 RepID=UPI00036EDC41|nr:DNA-deoxyinosine glycosylase [Methylosarcina fibrata]
MKNALSDIEGFPPIVAGNPHLLILGSMPGITSLQKRQYYGHAQNAFWPILGELFGFDYRLDYLLRKKILTDQGIAVWDVLQSCRRQGSLDANIAPASIRVNDFALFFEQFPSIRQVFFNGGMAAGFYKKYVLPGLPSRFDYLDYRRLPSTSPAHASLNFGEKLEAWRAILPSVVK